MGRITKYVTGDTADAKFASIETILQRMSIKLYQSATVYIPPIPLTSYTPSPADGEEIYRDFFVSGGNIVSLLTYCETFVENSTPQVKLTILHADGTSTIKTFTVSKGLMTTTLSLTMTAGDRLKVTIEGGSAITGLWFGLLFQVPIATAAMQSLAIADLISKAAALTGEDS